MLPFEHLVMELGGNEIFTDLFGKFIANNEATVFAWQNTEQMIDYRLDDFLTVEDFDLFQKRYKKERDMQYEAFGGN